MKKTVSIVLAAALIAAAAMGLAMGESGEATGFLGGFGALKKGSSETIIRLSEDGTASMDGKALRSFDYVWHADPSAVHGDEEDCPAEYFTGTAPDPDEPVYIARDIRYLPELPEDGFRIVNYDGERAWAYYYSDGQNDDRIFAVLPLLGDSLPEEMMSSEDEAYACPVLHITEPGTYRLEGSWNGQILVDLGDEGETFADESAKVTLVLGGVNVDCGSVAPAFIAKSAYEADSAWKERTQGGSGIDISADAGIKVVIADGTVNSFSGGNVPRMLKTSLKSGQEGIGIPVQKKARKTDGAFYSCVSMAIGAGEQGTGILNVRSHTYEGLDSELPLSIDGGNINIFAQDDGINASGGGKGTAHQAVQHNRSNHCQ